jgi:hypothetical protein
MMKMMRKKKARAESNEIFKMKREEWLSKLNQEQKEELELHKQNLKSLRGDGNDFEILRTKERQRHKEEMKRLKNKQNINL